MDEVIGFLSALGADASMRRAPHAALDEAMDDWQLDAPARSAILSGDAAVLQDLLGCRPMLCVQIPADEEEGDGDRDGGGNPQPGDEPPALPM